MNEMPQNRISGKNGKEVPDILIQRIVNTRECFEIISAIIPAVFDVFSRKSRFVKCFSPPLEESLVKGFQTHANGDGTPTLKSLTLDPELTQAAIDVLPNLVNFVLDLVNELSKDIEAMPVQEKMEALSSVLQGIDFYKDGEYTTSWAKVFSDIHSQDPAFFTKQLGPAFEKWFAAIDFGEVKDALDASEKDIESLVKSVNDSMWKYPAKVVLLFSFIPSIANLGLKAVLDTISRLNRLAPDLLTDVLLSLLREVDTKSLAEIINEVSEIARKSHTGSALLGDAGTPMFPNEISAFLKSLVENIDHDLFWRAHQGWNEGAKTLKDAFFDTLREHPEHLMHHIRQTTEKRNNRIQSRITILETLDELPEDEVADAVEAALSGWNSHDMAEVLNLFSILANRLHQTKPGTLKSLVSEFVHSVDENEVKETVTWFVEDMADVTKPLARAVLPPLVNGMAGWFAPEDDGHQEEVDLMLKNLRTLLTREVSS